MPLPDKKLYDFERIKWSGRYMIGFMTVTEGQKHSNDLFSTDNMGTAMEWFKMGFRVVDLKYTKQIYVLDNFMEYRR